MKGFILSACFLVSVCAAVFADVNDVSFSVDNTAIQHKNNNNNEGKSILLPGSRIFEQFTADPRKVNFSGGIRCHDDAFNRYKRRYFLDSDILGPDGFFGAVSFGSPLPAFRFNLPRGALQFSIEGCVWAIFAFKKPGGTWQRDSSTLLNSDYYMGFPIAYRYNNFSLQTRFYHISSHLGDEFLVLFPEMLRRNVSNEAFDLFASYYPTHAFRIYGGGGVIFHSFKGAKFDPLYVEYGAELRPFDTIRFSSIYLSPFIAAHLKNWQNNRWCINATSVLGLEFKSPKKDAGRVLLYFELHYGPSLEGQFYHSKTTYYSLSLSFDII